MANFYRVHDKAICAARGKVRSGEIWNVAMRETLLSVAKLVKIDRPTVAIVRFRAMENGILKPATIHDEHEISEWNKRHRNTPEESFYLS